MTHSATYSRVRFSHGMPLRRTTVRRFVASTGYCGSMSHEISYEPLPLSVACTPLIYTFGAYRSVGAISSLYQGLGVKLYRYHQGWGFRRFGGSDEIVSDRGRIIFLWIREKTHGHDFHTLCRCCDYIWLLTLFVLINTVKAFIHALYV